MLEAYLPAQMDEEAVTAIVAEVIAAEGATGPGDLGRVMKAAMPRMGGRADGKEVRAIAQRLLEGDDEHHAAHATRSGGGRARGGAGGARRPRVGGARTPRPTR